MYGPPDIRCSIVRFRTLKIRFHDLQVAFRQFRANVANGIKWLHAYQPSTSGSAIMFGLRYMGLFIELRFSAGLRDCGKHEVNVAFWQSGCTSHDWRRPGLSGTSVVIYAWFPGVEGEKDDQSIRK
jgi:hypothetical protein